jgi:hypothetical protein
VDSGKCAEQGGFPGSVGAKQNDKASGFDSGVDVVQNAPSAVAGVEVFGV